jgi:hypothetical protein
MQNDLGRAGYLIDIAYANGLFFGSGADSEPGRFLSAGLISSNGINWTQASVTPLAEPENPAVFADVAYGNGTFVSVGNEVFTSADGTNWTSRTRQVVPYVTGWGRPDLQGVTHGRDKFVAVGNGVILTSADGAEWTLRERPAAPLSSVAYGDGEFVAVGGNGTILTSTDGLTWQSQISGTNADLVAVAHGAGQFVAAGRRVWYGYDGPILTSAGGVVWTVQPWATNLWRRGITNGKDLGVGVAATFCSRTRFSRSPPFPGQMVDSNSISSVRSAKAIGFRSQPTLLIGF